MKHTLSPSHNRRNAEYLFALLLLLSPSGVFAANNNESIPEARQLTYTPVRFADYEVHYSTFNSTFISPGIAKQYSLKRSGNYGVVNVAIRNVKDSKTGKAVTGDVKGQHKNLMTQVKNLDFREVKEGTAIYYLADFKFSDEERLKFTIDVKPAGSQRVETVRFEQTFYEQ